MAGDGFLQRHVSWRHGEWLSLSEIMALSFRHINVIEFGKLNSIKSDITPMK
jgi:hypothetical protein